MSDLVLHEWDEFDSDCGLIFDVLDQCCSSVEKKIKLLEQIIEYLRMEQTNV